MPSGLSISTFLSFFPYDTDFNFNPFICLKILPSVSNQTVSAPIDISKILNTLETYSPRLFSSHGCADMQFISMIHVVIVTYFTFSSQQVLKRKCIFYRSLFLSGDFSFKNFTRETPNHPVENI